MNGLIPLSAESLAEVNAKARTRGQYKETLEAFDSSDEQGVQINLEDGPFAGKVLNTVKQGFNHAATAHNFSVRVVEVDEGLYLIRKDS